MADFPHHYDVRARAGATGNVTLSADGLADLASAPPTDFGGPGDLWSPEDLFVAAIVDCLVLTFRAIARASKLEWQHIDCSARGTLDQVDRGLQFTDIHIDVTLTVPEGVDPERAERMLHRAGEKCLITRSISAAETIVAEVVTG